MMNKENVVPGLQRSKSLKTVSSESNVKVNKDGYITDDLSETVVITRPDQARPSPLDLDNFLPFACVMLGVNLKPIIKVIIQDEYVTKKSDHSYIKRPATKSKQSKVISVDDNTSTKGAVPVAGTKSGVPVAATKSGVPVEGAASAPISSISSTSRTKKLPHLYMDTVYNTKKYLLAIALTNIKIEIPRRFIQIITLCVPFHSMFTKFSLTRVKITDEVLYEIGKMLPVSSITDLAIENCVVPQGNYYVLLDRPSQLKCLTLSRCKINDDMFQMICLRLRMEHPSSKSICALDLTSNDITDIGAQYMAEVLRGNRKLLHLNLSNNKLTDVGAALILDNLKEFPMTCEETISARKRKNMYMKHRLSVLQRCLKELAQRNKRESVYYDTGKKKAFISPAKTGKPKKLKSDQPNGKDNQTATEMAESMAQQIVGQYIDPFTSRNVLTKDGSVYCKGNLKLCSLNLAYNDLEYNSVCKLTQVISYQAFLEKEADLTGLLRVVIDGNNISEAYSSAELSTIKLLLEAKIKDNLDEGIPLKKKFSNPNEHKSPRINKSLNMMK